MSREFTVGTHRFRLLQVPGPERSLEELRLEARGLAMPMTDRSGWSDAIGRPTWWLGVEGQAGECRGGVAVHLAGSRALPGFRLLRVERLGGNVDAEALPDLYRALALVARTESRILRLHVEVFAAGTGRLERAAALARAAGFEPASTPRCYGRTLMIPLDGAEERLLQGFHATARRHIRAAERHPVAVRPIADPALAPRLDALLAETLARTGGTPEPHDWPAIIRFSAASPAASRLVGLFRTDQDGPEALLAYAWGCHHGDHAHYSTAASTRPADLKLPMAYVLAWDLIRWARASGARDWDFGGITTGSHGDADPLGGISDFKRYFGGVVAEVGAEWVYHPRPWASRLAALAPRIAGQRGAGPPRPAPADSRTDTE